MSDISDTRRRLWDSLEMQVLRRDLIMYLIAAGLFLLTLLMKTASALRLGIPLLYALIVPTVFHEWFYANYTLAYGIWYAMIAFVVLSWVVTILRRVREWL